MEQSDVNIIQHIATLSESESCTRELNVASFNGRRAMLDVRAWRQDGAGSKEPLNGVRLTYEEACALRDALTAYLEDKQP